VTAPALETIEIRASSGQTLIADVREPARGEAVGVVVLAHAMFARRTTFARPEGDGLADFLRGLGQRTVAFDFRGHGDSGPRASEGASWSFDDLVRVDLPAVVACARDRWGELPIIVLGHSLGGNVALASQGLGALGADALVLVAANMWRRAHEPSLARWLAKRATMEALDLACRRRGYLASRALRIGSDDECARYLAALTRCVRLGTWTSDDGGDDYDALTSRVAVPVVTVSSAGDRLFCVPECAERATLRVAGPRLSLRVSRDDAGGSPPGHMGIVTGARVRRVYARAMEWVSLALGKLTDERSPAPRDRRALPSP
jgi:predicted alpha/beta hydrolase